MPATFASAEPMLELLDVSCRLGDQLVINQLSLSVGDGEIMCLLGPSGSGKTTVLRLLAGFEQPVAGAIRLRQEPVASAEVNLPPERRRLGLVQQDYALFPHLSVARNVAFGIAQLDAAERRRRIEKWLQLVGLQDKAARLPHELSGGEQQRVALARSLAPQPDLLLLDEPFSNLDAQLRKEIAGELRELLHGEKITTVMVTHDRREALIVADRIAVLRAGELQQVASGERLLTEPANRFVAAFVGGGQWLPLERVNGGWQCPLGVVDTRTRPVHEGSELLLRPHDLKLDGAGVSAKVIDSRLLGAVQQCVLELDDGRRVEALLDATTLLASDEVVRIGRRAEALTLIFQSG